MTQRQEHSFGLDETLLNASGYSLMLQFKSPQATSTYDHHYKFSINRRQHEALERLIAGNPKSAYYVFPLYSKWSKVLDHSPNLIKDTWLVPVSCIQLGSSPPQKTYQIELRRDKGCIKLSGPNLSVNCEPINARNCCVDRQDQSLNPREVGIPSEILKERIGQWQESRLRFRGLNAVYLPG